MRSEIKTVAIVGGGVIGGGWAARCMLRGVNVIVYDPDQKAERKITSVIKNASRAYGKMAVGAGKTGRLSFADKLADAIHVADFVQENAPEREDLKKSVLQQVAACAEADVVIASSTSGLLPTRLQADCRHPERILVGHPFNPVYLLPLVELCSGDLTSIEAIARAKDFYTQLGMHPLIIRKEIDGFIADRLMEALWREALHLVNDGVASTDEIDQAVIYGAGLRWAFMGPFLTFYLAGGEGGMRHFMEQFGPALKLPWTKLEAPELSAQLLDRIVTQSEAQTAGQDIRLLEQKRDDCLIEIMEVLARHNIAAGTTLNDHRNR